MSKKADNSGSSIDKPVKKKKKESAWEFTRSMIILLGIVVIIKWFVCDIFFIPSGSMEQTLHGHPENGDRIFCTKLNYLWRNPERWEVFVFKFPYQQTPQGDSSPYKGEHFIKRCVGLPGESIALSGGDVFISKNKNKAKRAVKSNGIQDKIWMPVYSESFKDLSIDELGYYWTIQPKDSNSIQIINNSLTTDENNKEIELSFKPHTRFGALAGIPDRYVRRQVVEFSCPVIGCSGKVRKTVSSPKMTARCPICGEYLQESDVISYDYRTGYPANYQAAFDEVSKVADPQYRGEWWHFVPDLSFSSKLTLLSPESSLKCSVISNKTSYSALFTNSNVKVYKNGELLKETAISINQGESNSIQFYHLDGQLRAYLDGEEIINITADPEELTSSIKSPKNTNVKLSISGALSLSDISISRDIYYYNYNDNRGFFTLPDNGYMALGDNCPSSNDSRFWGPVPQANLEGTAQFIWWPLHAIKMLH